MHKKHAFSIENSSFFIQNHSLFSMKNQLFLKSLYIHDHKKLAKNINFSFKIHNFQSKIIVFVVPGIQMKQKMLQNRSFSSKIHWKNAIFKWENHVFTNYYIWYVNTCAEHGSCSRTSIQREYVNESVNLQLLHNMYTYARCPSAKNLMFTFFQPLSFFG